MPGPGGGGGGGGNESPEPVKKVELKGQEKITVPVEKPPAIEKPKDKPPEDPLQNLTIPAQTLASADLAQAGAMEGIPTSDSLGLGRGGGAGTGQGTGIGSGRGSGLGDGWGGGTGGGAYRPGNGVETPRLLREVKPQYTAQAMRAKIQGEVLLECIVQPDGSVGNIRVVRSLDASFGLDQEAIKAARQWRFAARHQAGPTCSRARDDRDRIYSEVRRAAPKRGARRSRGPKRKAREDRSSRAFLLSSLSTFHLQRS